MKVNTREKENKESSSREDSNVINFKIKGNEEDSEGNEREGKRTSVLIQGNLLEPFKLRNEQNYHSEKPLLLEVNKPDNDSSNNEGNYGKSKSKNENQGSLNSNDLGKLSILNNNSVGNKKSNFDLNSYKKKAPDNDNYVDLNSISEKNVASHTNLILDNKEVSSDKAYITKLECSSEKLKITEVIPAQQPSQHISNSSVQNNFRSLSINSNNNSKSNLQNSNEEKHKNSIYKKNNESEYDDRSSINNNPCDIDNQFDERRIIGAKITLNDSLLLKPCNSLNQKSTVKLEPLITKSNSENKRLMLIKEQSKQRISNKQSPKDKSSKFDMFVQS